MTDLIQRLEALVGLPDPTVALQAEFDAFKAKAEADFAALLTEKTTLETKLGDLVTQIEAKFGITSTSDVAPIDPLPAAIPGGNPDGTAAQVPPSSAAA